MSEKTANTTSELQQILDGIDLAASVVDWKFKFVVNPFTEEKLGLAGWFVYVQFTRPDTNTGNIGIGRGRDEIIWCGEVGAFESSIVKTAWVLIEMVVKHELMEAFKYRGVRIFDPHRTVEELSMPALAQR